MKRKFLIFTLLCAFLLVFPACDAGEIGSLKALSKPYIATYECVEARLGEQDLLEKYEYIKITLLDTKEFEVSFKPEGGEKRAFTGEYTIDPETREFQGEIGVLGFSFKEKTKIEKGGFVIARNFMNVPLYMKFELK